jgi:O-antigen ligase
MIWLLGGYMWLFVHRPFEVWPALGTLQIERIYMILMLVVWMFTPNKGWVGNRLHYVTAIFSILLLISWVLSPYMDQLICSVTVEDFFKVIVFYLLVLTTVRDERGLRILITLFLASVGLYMAHSLLEFINGRYEYRMGIRRMNGVDSSFGDPNGFASTLLTSLPLAFALWMSRPSSVMRLLLVCYALGVCVCIALTGSRTGFLGLLVFGMITTFLVVRRKALVFVLGGFGGVAALGLAAVALPAELQNRYLTVLDSSYGPKNAAESADSRMAGLLDGLRAWQDSPLLGHGPRAFDFVTGRMMGSHNLYGQVLAEMGLLGALTLAAYFACFGLNWLEIRRHYQNGSRPHDFLFHVSRGIGIIIILFLLIGWSGHTLYRYNWRWFAAFQAITVYCVRKQRLAVSDPALRPDLLPDWWEQEVLAGRGVMQPSPG